ncbi:hypothetical protein BGW41_003227 [Actinomortierella wolfii]|nr:hypothetical protein BGW41_003227 [Actinomortierella wolfii]
MPVYKQLGLYDEIISHSHPCLRGIGHNDWSSKLTLDDYSFLKERYGEYVRIIERPKLYEIMQKLVPTNKILFGRKVLSIEQNDEGVMVRTADGYTFHGDVLVGADGAYSSIRQAMYKQLSQKGMLPSCDNSEPPFNTLCLVGVTRPMPEDTVVASEGESRLESMMYKGSRYSTVFFTQPDRSVHWMVLKHAGDYQWRDDERFRNSEWGPEAADTMMNEVRDLLSPYRKPLGIYFDNTPRSGISKVMLEEKLYTTWHYGRTALIGDACHKFFPAAGQGALAAMLDAVVLANVLEACPTTRIDDIRRCLAAYKEERWPAAKLAYVTSVRAAQLIKRTFIAELTRAAIKVLPRWVIVSQFDNIYSYRPQVAFLPLVPSQGKIQGAPQKNYNYLRTPVTV